MADTVCMTNTSRRGVTGVLALFLALAGCSTQPLAPIREDLALKKAPEQAYADVIRALASQGFQIKTANKEAQLILTDPREFVVPRGLLKNPTPASVEVQVIMVGGRAQVQMSFRCTYQVSLNGQTGMSACLDRDGEAADSIAEQRAQVQRAIASAL